MENFIFCPVVYMTENVIKKDAVRDAIKSTQTFQWNSSFCCKTDEGARLIKKETKTNREGGVRHSASACSR